MSKKITLFLLMLIPTAIVNVFSQADAGPDQEICTDSTYMQAVDPFPNTGYWVVICGGGMVENPSLFNSKVTRIDQAPTVFEWTVNVGSILYHDLMTITSNEPYAIIVSPKKDTVIYQDFFQLMAVEPYLGDGIWTVSSPEITIDNPTNYTISAGNIPINSSIFKWSLSNYCGIKEDSVTITREEFKAYAGEDFYLPVYSNEATLNALLPIGLSGNWTVMQGNGIIENSTNPVTRVTNLSEGENRLRWTVSYAKTNVYDDIAITKLTETVYAGPDQEICTESTSMNAANPYPYEGIWTEIGGSGIITNPTLYNSTVTDLSPGINIFEWTVYDGSNSYSDVVQITNNRITNISVGIDREICSDSTTLNLNETGIWEMISGCATFTDTIDNTIILTDLCPGENVFAFTISNGLCFDSDTITITNSTPTSANAGPDQTVCINEAILMANNPLIGEGNWTRLVVSCTIENSMNYLTSVTGLCPGGNTFIWTISNGSCSSFDDVMIINEVVYASAGADETLCTDYIEFPIEENNTWSYLTGCGSIIENTTTNMWEINLCTGENELGLTVTNGICSALDTLVITNYSPSEANAGPDQTIYTINNTTNFNATLEPDETGAWSLLSGSGIIENNNDPNSIVSDLSNGDNVFRWLVENTLCSAYDDVTITLTDFVPFAGDDQIVCTDTAQLNANYEPLAIGQSWSLIAGTGTFDDMYNPHTVVRGLLTGWVHIFRWTSYFEGYSFSDDVMITNDGISVSAGQDTSICSDSYQMNAQFIEGSQHFWSIIGPGGGTIVDNTAWNTLVTNLPLGENVFNWHVDNGHCTSDDVVVITRNAQPIANFTVTPEEFTAPYEVLIENNSTYVPGFTEPDEFRWFINDEFLVTIYNYDALYHTFTNTGTLDSMFNIELSAADYETGCIDTVIHTILAHPSPESVETGTSNFKLYPNPANDRITIESNTDLSDAVIEIENTSGQSVYRSVLNQNKKEYEINISALADGFYVLKIISGNQIKLMKFVKI